MALENEVLAPFAGLALDGVVLTDFVRKERANDMPVGVLITPDYKTDIAGNKETVTYGKGDKQETSFILLVSEKPVQLNFVLKCPLVSPNNFANEDNKLLKCIITDDTAPKVRSLTYDVKKSLPRFKVVDQGSRSIPVDSISAATFPLYASLIHEAAGPDVTEATFKEVLKGMNINYLPYQVLNTNTNYEGYTWSPKVAIIELVD